MSEELLQRDLVKNPEKMGKWNFYNIGATSIKALKEYGIIRSVDYGKIERKKVDALIVQQKNVIAVIEYKKPSEFKTEIQKKKAINQEIEVAKALNCKIIIATDTKDTIWVNSLTGEKIKDEQGNEVKDLFNSKDEKIIKLIEKINDSISEKNNRLKPKKLINPTDLAKQIWQDVWSVSGATPENCLYTFVELFIFKYLSDLGVLKGMYSFSHLMKSYGDNENDEVLENYASTIRPQIKKLFPADLIDKTTIINGTIFVSKDQKAVAGYSTVFRKVLEKFERYGRLENIEPDFKSQLFESFLKESISKKNWGQFFTPLKVIRAITEIAKDEIKPNSKICDPACGVGKFLLEPISKKLNEFFPVEKNILKPTITIHGFDKGFDKDEQKTIILAKANMLIYFSDLIKENPGITNQFANLFNDSFTLKTNSILGTLSEPVENYYDLILTNPPYVTSGSSNLKDEIKKDGELMNYFKVNAMGVEGLFMEWIVKALKPGGKAFVVVPDGIFNRQNDKNLRQFILDECYIDGIISLPTKTFFTTPKKTYILAITKKINKTDIQKDPVFTYLASEIGESRDIYRFDIEKNDLQEAVTLYSFFKGNKQNFEKINSDPRCKIQEINKFNPTDHWSIDRWWTQEEKIKLGILEEDKIISIDEFPDLLEEVSNNILSYKEEILEINQKKKSKYIIKDFKITDIFDIIGESNITKSFLNSNRGKFPVYSGQTENNGLFGYLNTYKYDCSVITWATYGVHAGTLFVRNGKFNIGRNNCGLILKDEYKHIVSLNYVKNIAEQIFKNNAKGDVGTHRSLPQAIVNKIKIPLPTVDDKIDFDSQKEILKKYESIILTKQKVKEYKAKINELNVEIKEKYNLKQFPFEKLFISKSGNSKLTKKVLEKNKGDYVVYSANTKENGIFGYINTFDHDEECIQITTNGVYAGTVFYREKHKFSINGDARLLIKKSENLDYQYLLFKVQKEFLKHNFDWENKPTVGKLKNITILIPVNKNNEYDLRTQKEVAEKYHKIENIKTAINIELDKISETKINL